MTTIILEKPKLTSRELQFALLRHKKSWSCIKGARRGKLDIISEILLFCQQPKAPTNIMRNANLNYGQLKGFMENLTANGLLVKNASKYATTEKGNRFLEVFAQVNDMLIDFPR